MNTPIEQHIKNLEIYGYTVKKNHLDKSKVSLLKSRIESLWDQNKDCTIEGRPERDSEDKLVYNLQNKDKLFLDLLNDPFIRSVCMTKLNDPYYRFLPEDMPNYILNYFNARTSGNMLDLHIDSYIPSPGNYTWVMQVVHVLDDMNEENGCTVVVPGSHVLGKFTDREFENIKPLNANAGDLVIWDSRLWHGTFANNSKTSRWAIIATLSQWWIKQSMDMPRGLPEEIYAQLSEEQKVLLGYCSIPPKDEHDRINTKSGYEFLKSTDKKYYR